MSAWNGSGALRDDLSGWQRHVMELSISEAADALGVAPSTIGEARRRIREDGADAAAPRALRDGERAGALQKAWSGYRHSNACRTTKAKKKTEVDQAKKVTDVVVSGDQGPKIDSPTSTIRNRDATLRPGTPRVDMNRLRDAISRAALHASTPAQERAAVAQAIHAELTAYGRGSEAGSKHVGGWITEGTLEIELSYDGGGTRSLDVEYSYDANGELIDCAVTGDERDV